jgi:diaminopimelate epimerase
MMVTMDRLTFAKGHGTGNDFVLLPDPHGELPLTPALVAAVCDRRRGVGADGVLRVIRSAAHPESAARAAEAEWFMDYFNADGSLAQMCGNGVRVYARYLSEQGLASGRIPILTRAGLVVADVRPAAVTVSMPMPRVYARSHVTAAGTRRDGTVAACGNPNLVCAVADPDVLDLTAPLALDSSTFPEGANVEFVAPVATTDTDQLHVRMRVVERGVGETLSCGSGACAAAAVVLHDAGREAGTVIVDVPGGRLEIAIDASNCLLTGPAVIVARGEIHLDALST